MLYVTQLNEDTIILHDGYIQTGVYKNYTVEKFLKLVNKNETLYTESHWIPDIFIHRYARANYQTHMKYATVGSTDNSSEEIDIFR
jgi:predicted RNA-binding protein with PIN domain